MKILCFRPLMSQISTELKRPSGVGGFSRFHNCSFIGMSWCLVIDSDRTADNGNVFTLPDPCRQTAIVLEMLGTSLENLVGLIHNAAYAHWIPTEGWHRHCNFPLQMHQIEGIPSLSLLDDDLNEIASSDTGTRNEHCDDSDDSLNQDEYRVLIGAATAIARKRKNFTSWAFCSIVIDKVLLRFWF